MPVSPQRPLKALLFDLDGTVLDTNNLIVTSFQHVLQEHLGLRVAPEELYPHFGEPLRHTMAHFSPDRADELVRLYREFNLANHDLLTRPFPGLGEALVQLRECGLRLAIVTSKYEETARRGLDLFGLSPLFEALVGLGSTLRHKPEPDPALKALDLLGLRPEDAVMIGDSVLDVRCGRAAGTETAVVGWSAFPRADLEAEEPDYWMESAGDLLRFCSRGGFPAALGERTLR